MNKCPITYEPCKNNKYSENGLKLLSKSLKDLKDFPYSSQEQIQLATQLAAKLSIQGIQPKLSVILNPAKEELKIVETGGRFILKPPHVIYNEVPQNEDLTMKLASLANIEIPFHGMIHNIDGSLSYLIKRFDRLAHNKKIAAEDFSQLLGHSRDTKYESSMEKVASVIDTHCTFPAIEKLKLFRRVLFNFLVGNEDMHLKNFTLISYHNKVELSPAYDLLNTTIILQAKEEIALPIRGKKSKLNRSDLFDYFGHERLGIPTGLLQEESLHFERMFEAWKALIKQSFLSQKLQEQYITLIQNRLQKINVCLC
ncbi:MAG: HipA domain-containing protein [Chlamydiales bacterium]|nr:HipA domain-containing protein [Chlamydiales bacterium]